MNRRGLLGATAVLALMAGTAWAAPVEEDAAAEPLIVDIPADVAEGPAAAPAETTTAPQPVAAPVSAAAEPPKPAPTPAPVVAETKQQSTAAAELPVATDIPGVLTRKGALVIEPGIEYSHTNVNQFSFGGVAILDTVLVGAIQANQANRDAVTASLGLRLGVTDRMEAELRIPYMYRSDTTTNTFINNSNAQQSISLSNSDLGDIEAALHYQLNDGTGKWPVFVANFRVKSDSGLSPYEVKRDNLGIEQELATGSGFWGFEPSVTVIAPSDPAVFYGNIGYLWNKEGNIGKSIGNRYIESVDPGDAIRMGVGMGLALNEKVSLSIGYQHDWIMKTTTKFSDGDVKSPSMSVGSMTFGVNWQMTDNTALNVSVGVGVTNDAPDVRLMARVPITLNLW